jgi:hypothetical protein
MAGLEARHPLVDIDLIELILSYDPEMAFDVRYSRPLLRDALSGHLDDNVRLRRGKSFFDAVFHGSLSGPDRERARGLLDPRHAELGSYVDTSALYAELFSQPLDSHSEARQKWALTVWRAVTAELWLRQRTGPPATVTPKTFGERPDRFQVHLPGET